MGLAFRWPLTMTLLTGRADKNTPAIPSVFYLFISQYLINFLFLKKLKDQDNLTRTLEAVSVTAFGFIQEVKWLF